MWPSWWGGLGLKFWGKHKTQKEIVAELQSLTSTSSSFEQFYEADAHKTLYRSMHLLHRAETELKKPPLETLNAVFGIRKPGMFDDEDTGESALSDQISRDGLLRNYDNCKRLGVFNDPLSRQALEKGEAPQIQEGPAAGDFAALQCIIDPAVAPGVEKIVPNLVISPPDKKKPETPNAFQIAQALKLIESLEYADLLEREAADELRAHYEGIGKPSPDKTEESTEETPAGDAETSANEEEDAGESPEEQEEPVPAE